MGHQTIAVSCREITTGDNMPINWSLTNSTIYDTIMGMTKREKLERKILENPRNVSLEDFEALVRQYGHIEEGGKHPHVVIGPRMLAYKRVNPVRRSVIKNTLEIINDLSKQGEKDDKKSKA